MAELPYFIVKIGVPNFIFGPVHHEMPSRRILEQGAIYVFRVSEPGDDTCVPVGHAIPIT